MAGIGELQASYIQGPNKLDGQYYVAVKDPEGSHCVAFTTEEAAKKFAADVQKAGQLERTPEADTFGAPKKKSIGKGIASAFIPGLGQAIDGRFKDGLKDYAKNLGWVVGGTVAGLAGYNSFVKAVQAGGKTPYGFYAGMALATLATIGAIANRVHSAKDAYNGGKN